MKIIFLSHRIPYPPNKGDKIRSFHELEHFSRHHEVHLLAFCDDSDDLAYADELSGICRSTTLIPLHPAKQKLAAARAMLRGKPWSLGYYSSPIMRRSVTDLVKSTGCDLVFVFSSAMAQYADCAEGSAKVVDFVDSDASKWKQYVPYKPALSRWLYAYESRRLARFEESIIHEFDRSVFVSKREVRHLSVHSETISFIQNGIEINAPASVRPETSPPRIVFVGAMDYFPNIDAVCYFAKEILPRIRVQKQVEFMIVGSNPSPRVVRLGRQPGVFVTGKVDSVRPYLDQSSVAVVPTRIAQGIQNKILEALAAGLPVVTTRAAAEGLASVEGIPLAVADSPHEFAEHVIRFIDSPPTPDQLRESREHLQFHYSWDKNLATFDQIFALIR